jgi:putative hydrolase of the HAD superfamily
MVRVSLLFWDIGGVILSNAWDHADRQAAAERFGLDGAEFERRHDEAVADFEKGRIDEESYLSKTVFYAPRPFSREALQTFMRDRSVPLAASLDTARALRAGGAYVMVALNNESIALNEFRITTFHLRDIFHVFLSSCYTGLRKPDPEAYLNALRLTQRDPEESLLLDDRLDNVKAAAHLGLRTLWVRDPGRLREDLAAAGIAAG